MNIFKIIEQNRALCILYSVRNYIGLEKQFKLEMLFIKYVIYISYKPISGLFYYLYIMMNS